MTPRLRTPAGSALTDLILDLFRLNNRVLAAGDRLISGLGLTSGRWQVLGTIVAAERAQPVAWLARDMGANRQNIQRIVNDLERDGLVMFKPNPHHKRAQLVVLTDEGRRRFDAAMKLQAPWVNDLAEGLPVEAIETTRYTMAALLRRLEGHGQADGQD
ncbi:MarR family winged helix-turn-helix transcriptional regulator [Methyloceanibacter sp. wino2]|uniref:MarR family winged helix-turn-helix transcriptional regulator n=1 Tax=Methyloceanibacter sp. wino2 TaxID=2170729 RepID=UPI000D3E67A9|nr:MarR family winged helix-turn-helix transcriptional regulator [Methyloceanibacter sp. wino2]